MKGARIYTSAAGSIALASLLVTSLAIADVASGTEAPANADLIEILSGVDHVPTGDQLLEIATVQEIIDIARDPAGDTDQGLRIRAYRALADFPSETTKTLLIGEVGLHADAMDGVETLYCRAAMHSLAKISNVDDIDSVFAVAANLTHANRDVRAAAAQGLAVIGSEAALPALREQLEVEKVTQVQLAISEAIRQLTIVTSE